jgi:CHRD domain
LVSDLDPLNGKRLLAKMSLPKSAILHGQNRRSHLSENVNAEVESIFHTGRSRLFKRLELMKMVIGALISVFIVLISLLTPAIAANPSWGDQSFTEYAAYLHPAQEPDTELNSQAKGYGHLRFPKNLSTGNVDVQLEGIDPANVTAFHIHCGSPGVLGPILQQQWSTQDSPLLNKPLSLPVLDRVPLPCLYPRDAPVTLTSRCSR